jgi:hypothetical protein
MKNQKLCLIYLDNGLMMKREDLIESIKSIKLIKTIKKLINERKYIFRKNLIMKYIYIYINKLYSKMHKLFRLINNIILIFKYLE